MNTNTQRRGVPQGDFLRGTETQRERREKQKSQNEKIFALSAFDLLCVPSASLRLRVSLALGHSGKFLIYAVALGLTLSQPAFAAKAKKPAPPATAEVAEKQSDLKDLRGQIESLRKDMAATEGTRADVVDQLKDSEREISITQRDLHQLGGQRVGLQTTLKDLGAQAHDLENRLNSQQNQLEKLVYRQYLQGNPDALHLLLNGDDPNQLARDLHYWPPSAMHAPSSCKRYRPPCSASRRLLPIHKLALNNWPPSRQNRRNNTANLLPNASNAKRHWKRFRQKLLLNDAK